MMGSIKEIKEKIKNFLKIYQKEIILSMLIIFVSLISFGLGHISRKEYKNEIKIIFPPDYKEMLEAKINFFGKTSIEKTIKNVVDNNSNEKNVNFKDKKIIVASKNGKRYYFLWCKGVERIKEENKIWFNSEEEAQSRGYTLAKSCEKN